MKVLIACEFSGRVREAFTKKGHESFSCDLLPSEIPGNHFQCNVLDILDQNWDLMIAFPPCTNLAVSGARWFKDKLKKNPNIQKDALDFVRKLMKANIEKICIENPKSIISNEIRKPDQIIHPYQHGHFQKKLTCLWLKNLPLIKPTNMVGPPPKDERLLKKWNEVHHCGPSEDRWKIRSRTFQGFADAFADQWG